MCFAELRISGAVTELADMIWFMTAVRHQFPLLGMIFALAVYFISGAVKSLLAHGWVVGGVTAAMWISSMLGAIMAYPRL